MPSKRNLVIALAIVGLLAAVGLVIAARLFDTSSRLSQASSVLTGTSSGNSSSLAGSEPTSGPVNDQVYYSISADPARFPTGTKIADHASVPDVVQLNQDVGNYKKGDLLIYFVDFASPTRPDSTNISVIDSSNNAQTWSQRTSIKIANRAYKGVTADPAIVQLLDGRLRLYVFGSELSNGDPAQQKSPHRIYSAVSSDGINFNLEPGYRVQDNQLTDPDVILWRNQWYLYYSGIGLQLLISNNGLDFTRQALGASTNDIGGVPAALPLPNGVRLYGCGKVGQGIQTGFASDGINFTKDGSNIVAGGVCDPSVIKLANGQYLMVYKVPAGQKQ